MAVPLATGTEEKKSTTVKVQDNGKAPSGLKAGDKVVTGGGTYTINSVNPDGTYKSSLSDKNLNTANYDPTGKNDISGWVGNSNLYNPVSEKAPSVSGGGGAITGKAGAITGGGSINDNSKYYQDMLNEIKNTYGGIASSTASAQRAALDAAVGQMEGNRNNINSSYEDLARQLYIDRRQAERKIPQQLAAQGYTGGLSESSNLGLQTAYQELLSKGDRSRISELANLDSAIANMRASGELSIANQGAQISQNALNSYMQIMSMAASDKRWATELGISQQNAANQLAWAQQQWADQQAWNQQQFDASQTGNSYANNLKLAQLLAEYGDFSGYGNMGVDTTQMQNYYQQLLNAQKKTSGGSVSGGSGGTGGSTSGFDEEAYWLNLLYGGSYANSM